MKDSINSFVPVFDLYIVLPWEYLYPSKKVTQHDCWSIIFLVILGFYLSSLNEICLFASRLMPYLLGLFHWGACRLSKSWGEVQIEKLQQWINLLKNAWAAEFCVLCMRISAHSLRRKVSENSKRSEKIVLHAWIQHQKGKRAFHIQSDRFCKF